jgi:hypothetical protein
MAKQVQLRRGNTTATSAFTGAEGELTVNTDNFTLRVHDGATPGGRLVGGSASMNGFFPGTPTVGQVVFAGRPAGPITISANGFILDALTLPTSPVTFTLKTIENFELANFVITQDGLDQSNIIFNGDLPAYELFYLELTSAPNGIADIMYTFFTPDIL